MKWIKASERKPKDWEDNIIIRDINSKILITDIWKFHEDCIEMNNGNTISGAEFRYDEVEWLDESYATHTNSLPTQEEIEKEIRKHLSTLPYAGGYPSTWRTSLSIHLAKWMTGLLQPKSEWISVEDRLPEKRKIGSGERSPILVATEKGNVFTTTYTALGWANLYNRETVTHWQPLPKPPKQ